MRKLIDQKIILFGNTDWYLYNFRMSLLLELQKQGADILLLSPPGDYGPKLRVLGFSWRPLVMQRRSLNPVRELRLLFQLAALFRKEAPFVVHGFTIKCAVYGAIAARLAGVDRRVSAINGLGYVFTSLDRKARVLRPLVTGLMRLAFGGRGSWIVVQNPDDRRAVERAGIAPSSIRLIPGSGVDLGRFRPTTRSRSAHEPFRVLMPARLLWDKGIGEFVAAARLLRGQGIEFLIAGDADLGNPASVPPATLDEWRRDGLVTLLGHVPDIASVFAGVDAVVLPSYREGLPKALIEAAACGLPLVTTDVPGCRDVVSDGTNGLLVPMKDAQKLAEAIASLKSDPALASRLGVAARERAIRCFDDKIIVAETLALYADPA